MPGLPLLLLIAAQSATPATPEHFRAAAGPDLASELVLHPDGRFEYALAAGALDEHAKGRWTTDGKTVWLTTEPKPHPPVFALAASSRSTDGPLFLKVQWPDGRGIPGVDLALGFATGEPIEGYTQEDGWALPPDEPRIPTWVQFAVPMHELLSPPFEIDTSHANLLTFVLEPHDMGTADFQRLPLERTEGGLIMHRAGGDIPFVREGP